MKAVLHSTSTQVALSISFNTSDKLFLLCGEDVFPQLPGENTQFRQDVIGSSLCQFIFPDCIRICWVKDRPYLLICSPSPVHPHRAGQWSDIAMSLRIIIWLSLLNTDETHTKLSLKLASVVQLRMAAWACVTFSTKRCMTIWEAKKFGAGPCRHWSQLFVFVDGICDIYNGIKLHPTSQRSDISPEVAWV
jgi:hypothetical protein